jgi:hypothetical protein
MNTYLPKALPLRFEVDRTPAFDATLAYTKGGASNVREAPPGSLAPARDQVSNELWSERAQHCVTWFECPVRHVAMRALARISCPPRTTASREGIHRA